MAGDDKKDQLLPKPGKPNQGFRIRILKLIACLRLSKNRQSSRNFQIGIEPAEAEYEENVMIVENGSTGGDGEDVGNRISMTAGNGECSYAANSDRQHSAFRHVEPSLARLIKRLTISHDDDAPAPAPAPHTWPVLRVADLGCATGNNALAEVDAVVKAIQTTMPTIPVQVFFNDLPSNDFNGLLRLVQEQRKQVQQQPQYMACAVAGSFYDHLFPPRSMHVAFSMMALHWLSRVPPAVLDAAAPATWIDGRADAAAAYAEQAADDLRQFLRRRAADMCSGGVVWLCMMGRRDGFAPERQVDHPHESAYCGPEFEVAWDDVVAAAAESGNAVVSAAAERLRRRFKLPWYFRSAAEVREAAEEKKEEWNVLECSVMSGVRVMSDEALQRWTEDAELFGRQRAALVRSFVGSMVDAVLGPLGLTDVLFQRLALRSAQFLRHNLIRPSPFVTLTVVGLQRK